MVKLEDFNEWAEQEGRGGQSRSRAARLAEILPVLVARYYDTLHGRDVYAWGGSLYLPGPGPDREFTEEFALQLTRCRVYICSETGCFAVCIE